MPVKGWKAVGVSVKEEEYPILMRKLKEMGFLNLQQLVKTIIYNNSFTSKFTSKIENEKNTPLQTNGGFYGKVDRAGFEPATTRVQTGYSYQAELPAHCC